MMYGVVISDSIKRGDRAGMEKVLAEAEAFMAESVNVKKAIADLKKAIKKKPGIDPRPLYGVPISDAIKRGNLQEMKSLLIEARSELKRQTELSAAIKDLENALKSK